jgi:deferrochelatase/peroxidase EfeB
MNDEYLSKDAKADIQGFVTSGYGHLIYAAYLLFGIGDRQDAQDWLRSTLSQVTTAQSWRTDPDLPKSRPQRALNIAFTAVGLTALGLSGPALLSFPDEFRAGIASERRSQILGDTGTSAPETWEVGRPNTPSPHFMLILHATSQIDLDAWCSEIIEVALQHGLVEYTSAAQQGYRPQHDREPFGFFDAVGQPDIHGIKGTGIQTGEFILGYRNEYGYFPVSPAVSALEDPFHVLPASENPYRGDAYRDIGANGTFLVYRKLQQDVAGFWRFMREESVRNKGEADPRYMVWLASNMVGRWPNGVPLVLSPEPPGRDATATNEFGYAQVDPKGIKCPFGAHIRRTNPRDQLRPAGPAESIHMSARHRILRRGRAFGTPLFDPMLLDNPDDPATKQTLLALADDGGSRGIHFFCVNASIKRQFEFVQQAWMDNPHFNGLVDNRDPISGDNEPEARSPSAMVIPGRHGGLRTAPLPRFVTVLGGLYLFMPSMTALRYLANKPL